MSYQEQRREAEQIINRYEHSHQTLHQLLGPDTPAFQTFLSIIRATEIRLGDDNDSSPAEIIAEGVLFGVWLGAHYGRK